MTLATVVETWNFAHRAKALMSDDDRMDLIDHVARNPETGVSIGGHVRKFRFARPGKGKKSGFRVIHVYDNKPGMPVFLVTVFAKNEKANLTRREVDLIKKLGKMLAGTYGERND